jgi:hypothetical protein
VLVIQLQNFSHALALSRLCNTVVIGFISAVKGYEDKLCGLSFIAFPLLYPNAIISFCKVFNDPLRIGAVPDLSCFKGFGYGMIASPSSFRFLTT